jgi:hypothetical protein
MTRESGPAQLTMRFTAASVEEQQEDYPETGEVGQDGQTERYGTTHPIRPQHQYSG